MNVKEKVNDDVSIPVGGGVLPIMSYTGRLHPKGVPFSGFRYIKG